MESDDAFDDESSELSVIARDWEKIRRTRNKDGFVNGAEAGQKSTIQDGFNVGFNQGFLSSFLLSKIKGILNGLMAYHAAYEGHPISDDVILKAQHILEKISKVEADFVAQDFFNMNMNSHSKSNVDDSLIMDVDELKVTCGCLVTDASSQCSCKTNHPLNVSKQKSNIDHEMSSQTELQTYSDLVDTEMNLHEAKILLLKCPEIAEIVQDCKQVLKRLCWSDETIDDL